VGFYAGWIPAGPDARMRGPADAWFMQDALRSAPLRLSILFVPASRRRVAAMVGIDLLCGGLAVGLVALALPSAGVSR
jgi:hypothetical protein